MDIPFNRPFMTGKELQNISSAHTNGDLCGDGVFTHKCHQWIESRTGTRKALLTHSCTAALEMACILAGLGPEDEVIMPSYTFVSTANAFVLRGATPVFVDIRPDTLNIDETLIEQAITEKTKAIVPVHYAGVACEMDTIMAIADKYGLIVIEDAAQGVLSSYKERSLGTIGHMGTFSFHETKNIISGEGGALLVNDERFLERAEIIREKGTNRSQFFRGQVDKYTWFDIGSSYLPGEIIAAFLYAQLEEADTITSRRLAIWQQYKVGLDAILADMGLRGPEIPVDCNHNGHMFYLICNNLDERTELIYRLKEKGINCTFHYIPLHSSKAGEKYCKKVGSMKNTDDLSARLLRLPIWLGLEDKLDTVITEFVSTLNSIKQNKP